MIDSRLSVRLRLLVRPQHSLLGRSSSTFRSSSDRIIKWTPKSGFLLISTSSPVPLCDVDNGSSRRSFFVFLPFSPPCFKFHLRRRLSWLLSLLFGASYEDSHHPSELGSPPFSSPQ